MWGGHQRFPGEPSVQPGPRATRQSPEPPDHTAAFAMVCTGIRRDAESSSVSTKPGRQNPTLGCTRVVGPFLHV